MKRIVNGYSLIELVVCVVLIGVISSITLPNFSRFFAQLRLNTSISEIFKSLHLARAYAVSHSANITICPLVSGSCKKDWSGNIYVFEDSNSNLTLDSGEYVVRFHDKISSNDELTYPRRAITYRADGSINFMQSGSFLYCNKVFPKLSGNRITVSQVGRVRIVDSNKCEKADMN